MPSTETYQPSHRARLAAWLRTSSAYDLTDDAVMGCLEENTVLELFEDFGIPWTPESRRWFARELDTVVTAP